MSTAFLTIDLDTVAGDLAASDGADLALRRRCWEAALPRLLVLLEEAGVKATFFAVGLDALQPWAKDLIKSAVLAGHEIASHSFSHDRTLPFKPEEEIFADLQKADQALAGASGRKVLGFRSPGATLTPALLAACARLDYVYDSSLNPSLAYNLAKAAYAGFSGKELEAQFFLTAPTGPYLPLGPRADRHCPAPGSRRGPAEIPLTSVPFLSLPFMNYFLMRLGRAAGPLIQLTAAARPFVNYVLHDHELLAADDLKGLNFRRAMTSAWLDKGLKPRADFIKYALAALARTHKFELMGSFAEDYVAKQNR
ncbi:MAG: polysaccharide deacetylase family protein [Elusimicrobiales bacterium]|nr:polysaccharide deacetylase family protein [Elusimicrobiales bacterium]